MSDASPLILLARMGRLDILRQLFGQVHIPRAVVDEVKTPGANRFPRYEWIASATLAKTQFNLPANLGAGEREAIELAAEMNADLLLLDDKAARRFAAQLGLPIAGTLGVLSLAYSRGLISHLAAAVDEFKRVGGYVDDATLQRILDGS